MQSSRTQMMENRYVIIVAGGRGLRMGTDVPKQFLPIGGRPVLMHTVERFHEAFAAQGGIHIVLVLPQDQHEHWAQLCRDYRFGVPHQVATGGATRFHSVQNGLALVPDEADGVVGVHDGVRPFVAVEAVRRLYDAAWEHGAAVPVVPVVETIRQMLPEGDSQTVDRGLYRLVQTPQTFRTEVLKEAYRQPYEPAFTDDASVVEALGHRIALVEGNRENIKLTTPEDLRYAEYLIMHNS